MNVKTALKKYPLAQKVYRRVIVPRSRQHEPDLYLVRENSFDTAVDVGANVGTYAIELAKVSRQVIAFEPVRSVYEVLKNVVPSNVGCYQFALGETNKPGTILIPYHDGQLEPARATITPTEQVGDTEQVIEIRSFDASWAQFRSRFDDYIDFVKIDVEGYELSSLKGMLDTVKRFFPVLMIEIEVRYNPSFFEVFDLLDSLGYRSFYSPDGVVLVRCSAHDLPRLQTNERLDRSTQRRSKRYSRGEEQQYINNFWFLHFESRAASRLEKVIRAS